MINAKEAVTKALQAFQELQVSGVYENLFVEGVEMGQGVTAWAVTLSYSLKTSGMNIVGLPGPRQRTIVELDALGQFRGMHGP